MLNSEAEQLLREVVEKALHIQQMDSKIAMLEKQVESLAADREKAMRWGIMTLGAGVLAMATWIFNSVTGHIK